MYKLNRKGSRSGFTLAEIMIVIGIIGIFSAVVIGSTSGSRVKARDNRRIIDLKEIQLGLALFYDVNKAYPVGSGSSVLSTALVGPAAGFLPEIPTDPQGTSYEYSSAGTTYCLGATLEDTSITYVENSTCSTGGVATYKVQR